MESYGYGFPLGGSIFSWDNSMEQNGENDSSQENIYPPPGTYIDSRGNEIYFGTEPEFRSFWVFFPDIMNAVSTVYKMIKNHRKTIDFLSNQDKDSGKEKDAGLDSIGGGHLLKRISALDPIGGGHLLKRAPMIDGIGGGHLLKRGRNDFKEFLMQGNTMKRRPVLDSIGGGHLLKRFADFKQSYPMKREDDTNKKLQDDL
ncbi:hypothetical protein Phum_PHUM263680 [Pediculus humanus corporis]|uniref:Uncharacterized protein n=1 Tax=Pediculus humanus subsp. corporis TaxID=121224 RepID=E0VKH8_PEDHC|nr:uncharacterized protein Phum_PHUM263680 [Pediculus humanus corporis]EEB13884.1 hypothetical protein Phum_PHUM263680 [Pediculus humanus corporis]